MTLHSVGLGGLAHSGMLSRIGHALLARDGKGPRECVIASGLGRGLRLRVLPETPKSYRMGTHELQMQSAMREHVRPGMVVYDCGANVGYFSALLARLVGDGGRVYAFEPSPASLECLRAAVELNGLSNLTVVPEGVWDERGTLRFRRGDEGASLVVDHVEGVFGEATERDDAGPGSCIDIKVNSLDNFVYEQGHAPPDFIKLDVEGAEGHAMRGARRLLAERRPGLLLEIHGEPGREVWSLLKELNYTATDISNGEVPQTADQFAVWIRQYLALPGRMNL